MKIYEDYITFVGSGGVKKRVATLLFNPCFHSVCLYRLSNLFFRMHLSIIAKIIWYCNRLLFHVDIDYRADLAGGFQLIHGLGVVIGKSVCSKGNLTVYQGVTLGGTGKTRVDENGKVWGQPLLEDGVIIYTDAKVLGPVIISRGSIIKAGRIVTDNI